MTGRPITTGAAILAMLHDAGIDVWLSEGNRIGYRCRRGALTAKLRTLADEHRQELLAELVAPRLPVACASCGREAPVMRAMRPLPGGRKWALCAACFDP